jgi:glutathionylspermidine synthase
LTVSETYQLEQEVKRLNDLIETEQILNQSLKNQLKTEKELHAMCMETVKDIIVDEDDTDV